MFSNSKTVSALALAMLVDRGLISYDDKVTKHWPEFADKSSCNGVKADCGNKGKMDLTIADVLRHEAGMSTFKGSFKSVKSLWPENIKKNEIGEVIEKEVCRYCDLLVGFLA